MTRPPISHVTVPSPSVNLVDTHSLFLANETIALSLEVAKPTVDFARLQRVFESQRKTWKWRPANVNIALVSADLNSEGQHRFTNMLIRTGFEAEAVHYRDLYPSLPPGKSPADTTEKPRASFSSRMAFALGLLAQRDNPEILVLSHSFELCWPLLDLKRRRPDAKVGLAYFGTLLDPRWKRDVAIEPESPIAFLDLDEHMQEILGLEIAMRSSTARSQGGGLNLI